MENQCQHIEELLAAYALDALEIDEKLQVETHLDTCVSCQRVLSDYQAVSHGLMAAQPPVQPPAHVRARLLSHTVSQPEELGWVERWRSLFPKLGPIVALVAVLILVVFNLNLLRNTNQILETQKNLSEQNRAYQTAFALLTYPDSEVVVIDDGEIYGTLVYDPDGQVAVLNVWGLEALTADQAYQVWLIEPDETRISGGVFQSSDSAEYVSFVIESPNSLESFVGLGVTIEPEGGSPGPTGPRIFGIKL
jgi:anti-sigma-K factor RskA